MDTTPLELLITGDIAPIRHFADVAEESPLAVYGNLLPVIRHADYRIANLESTLVGEQFIVKSGAAFAGKRCHLPLLTDVPFDAVTLANNHAVDTGRENLCPFLAMLHDAGIATVGAGLTQTAAEAPLVIRAADVSIALFNMSEGEDMMAASGRVPGVAGWDARKLCARIRRAKASGKYTAVIAVIHCGLEYYPFPPMYVYEAFRAIAESGADLVVGHHVHVPQGMTRFGETPAYFSLGNFAFYQENRLLYRKTGYMLKVLVSEKGIIGTEPVFYRIDSDSLRLLKGSELRTFRKVFSRISAPLSTPEGARLAWRACLKWYGAEGYRKELETILEKLKSDPPKGAAMLRNRVNCMQHRMHWTDGLGEIISPSAEKIPADYISLVNEYFTETLP